MNKEQDREIAHKLLDKIFKEQDNGENCDCATYERMYLTEEGVMKRIRYFVRVKIEEYAD